MAISVAHTTSANTLSVTIPSTTAGNCLVVCVMSFSNSGAGSVSGITLGGSADNFAQAVAGHGTNGFTAFCDSFIWCDPNCAGGQTSIVISGSALNVVAGDGGVVVYEVSGLVTSSVVDKTSNHGTSSGTSWTSNATATTSQANEFWVGCADTFNTHTAPGSPWTDSGAGFSVASAGYQIVSSTGTATYNGTQSSSGTSGAAVATLLGAAGNVSVALTTAQVTAAAPDPSAGAGPLALPVAQETVAALPPAPVINVAVSLPAAQVTVSAPAPFPQMSGVSLPVAQVDVAAPAPSTSVNVSIALPAAEVTVSALPPALSRQLLISLASAAGTDDYGNPFPLGIQATAGLIEGPEIVGSNAFFYSSKTLGGLVQSITEADGVDAYGNAYIAGTATYANNGTFWSAVVVDSGVVTWYKATTAAGPWTSEAGIGFSWNSLAGGGLTFTGPAGNDMSGDLNVTGSITVSVALTVNGTDVRAALTAIHTALSGASTSTNGLANGTISGTSGAASAGTAHTHPPGSYSVTSGLHAHTLPTFTL